jgi:hypothetical protein
MAFKVKKEHHSTAPNKRYFATEVEDNNIGDALHGLR